MRTLQYFYKIARKEKFLHVGCGKTMVTVIIKNRAACIMTDLNIIGLLKLNGNFGREVKEK